MFKVHDPTNQLEVHDPVMLAQARAVLDACSSPRRRPVRCCSGPGSCCAHRRISTPRRRMPPSWPRGRDRRRFSPRGSGAGPDGPVRGRTGADDIREEVHRPTDRFPRTPPYLFSQLRVPVHLLLEHPHTPRSTCIERGP